MPRRLLEGTVVSDVNNKTVVVAVVRYFKHPRYFKTVSTTKNFHVHDEGNEARKGDRVQIEESSPISKLKKWRLIRVLTSH
jgi:small subunit ribosomal protein S17